MPVRSDMKGDRRYGSTSSLNMNRDLRFSATSDSMYSDDKNDSMYQSSPNLSQGSHAHTRSSSTDSMDGYYGNHSRQSSGSTDNYKPSRLSSSNLRKSSSSTLDPLQFVKMKGADDLASAASKQMEAAREVNKMRGLVDTGSVSEEPDWQSNFNSWKTKRRKSASEKFFRVGEAEGLFGEEEEKVEKRPKTFGQIMADKEKRRSLGPMSFYPIEDDDSGIGGTAKPKDWSASKTENQTTESKPKGKKLKEQVAPWAHDSSGEADSQSDSETNNSHQSGDTDSVFSDKSTPSKVLSDDDSWVKARQNSHTTSEKMSTPIRTGRPLSDNFKLFQNNGNESQKKDEKKRVETPTNSAKKIKNITQAFEKKEKEAHAMPAIERHARYTNSSPIRKSFDNKSDKLNSSYAPPWKSLDLTNSPKGLSVHEKSLSPTSPKALVPKDQRYHPSSLKDHSLTGKENKKFTEKMIKINQKPNNDRGFGFFLVGGVEKKQPIIVQRVSLGSAADVCEVEANDELLSVNGRDVTKLTLAQVQGMVDHSVKRGQIELKIRRFCDDGTSMYGSPMSSDNNLQDQSDGGFSNKQTLDDSYSYRPALQISTKTDDNNRLRLMDQLIDEKQREANNNQVKPHHYDKPPSPTVVEMTADVSFSSQVAPPSLPKTDVSIQPKVESPSPSVDIKDMSYPVDEILTEERKTISVRRTTDSPVHDQSPVAPRRRRTPVKQLEEVMVVDSPSPPTPPRADPPPLAQPSDTNEDSGFGPPAALMRWQTRKTRAKSEYQIPFSLDEKTKASHRLSSTLPYGSDFKFSLDKDYSKDDSMLNKVTQDFEETMTVSKPLNVKPTPYHFDDSSKMEAWQQKVDQQRMPDPPSPTSPIEMEIQMEEHLTAQFAAPARKVGQPAAPNLMEINVPYNDEAPMSPQEKFERDQRKIRLQYEEEKRRARDSEKQKQNQDKQVLNSDKLLRSMESQIQQTKSEAANQDLANMQPLRPTPTEPRFNSEPVTFRLQSNTPGRQLVIDPRNQVEQGDPAVPEYSFRVNLSKATNSGPPLRDLSQQQELSHEELLEREREKIREEEKRKFEEERQKWKEEQERELHQQQEKIRQERERLQREHELVEREKAMLEQKKSQEDVVTPRYQSINHHVFSPKSSSTGSPASSLSPHSPPSALEPKYGRDTTVKKSAPPPTAPKPEKKGRLTREDLLAMNRKATPMTSKPEGMDGNDSKESGYNSLREAPSKGELHSLNAVPRPKFRSSAAWIKDEEEQNNNNNNKEKPFVIGRRSDVIHQKDYSNPQDHWLVREAEKRRLADQTEHANVGWNNSDGVTAHAGVTKPSQSSLVNQFRGDIEPPPRNNRHYASSQIGTDVRSSTLRPLSSSGTSLRQFNRSPDSTGVLQFNAKTQQNNYASPPLAQTLPANFSFNANNSRARDLSSVPSKPPRSPAEEADPVIAVSGKQKCSHCGEELGFGAAMVIESLGLYYHVQCFRCCVCRLPLGNGSEGADVRVRVNKLHCRNCYSNDEAGLKFSKV